MKKVSWRQILWRAFCAGIFGAAFLWFTEIGQPSLMQFTGGSDCCARCSSFLYDRDQPVLALSAAVAFFGCFFIGGRSSWVKFIAKLVGFCWLSFQIYTVWVAWHLLLRTPCTALYSPGPVLPIGIFVVLIVLLIDSTVWAALCALPVFVWSLGRKFAKPEKVRIISLKNS